MPHRRDNDRLSSGDALFLHLEREGMPLNVASVNVFEGVISLEACTEFIELKLPLIPRYLQRVVAPPFNIGLPTWEYDPNFEVRNHVHEVTLKRGTDAEFKAVAGKVLSKVMDRQRPLWDFTLVGGLKGNRTGVVFRMHHCLADGMAGVGLLNVIMDPSPEVRPLPVKKRFQAQPRRETSTLLDGLLTSPFSLAQWALTAQMELLNVFQHLLEGAGHGAQESNTHLQPALKSNTQIPSVDESTRLMLELTAATQRLPFNIVCRGPQKFSWAEIPMAAIKAVKQACGATVNDVVLTLLTSAIRRYAELQRVRIRGRLLRIVVPVSVRGQGNENDLGNRITFLPVTIPLDIRNPRKLLAAIRKRMAFLKSAHVAEFVGLAGTMLGTIPTAAQVLVGPIASQLPLGLCNIICTNVPGPKTPLYLLGHKMLRCYPYVPIGGDMGINCAVLTYDGTAYFGFTGDLQAAPDLGRLEKFLTESFAELQKAVGVAPQRRSSAPTEAKVAPCATSAPTPEQPLMSPDLRIPAKPPRTRQTTTQKENVLLARVGA